MPVGVFPVLKLSVLFVKQISKPLAKFLVNQAKNHPFFRTYIIIPPAQCKCIFLRFKRLTTLCYQIFLILLYVHSLSLDRGKGEDVRYESW